MFFTVLTWNSDSSVDASHGLRSFALLERAERAAPPGPAGREGVEVVQ